MHITHLAEHCLFDPDDLSGTAYWISKGLENAGVQIHNFRITTPHKLLPPLEEFAFRCKHYWLKFFKKTHLIPDFFSRRAHYVAENLREPLKHLKTDVILTSLTPLAGAFLETSLPIVYWTDAVYAGLIGFYPEFRFHSPDTMWDGYEVTKAALMNAKLLIFSSQWAARGAVEFYGIAREKIKVVPFGANLAISHSYADIKNMIAARSKKTIHLLFVGKNWYRKGGDIVLKVANQLYQSKHDVKVTIVGCTPKENLPDYITCIGKLSKKNKADLEKLKQLYQESHLLFLPSRAEACAIVFAEANAFGLPCITTHVGGIAEAIKDNVNGMTFSLEATIGEISTYIANLVNDHSRYQALALSSFNEYQTRLNWQAAGRQVKTLIEKIM